VPVQVRLRAPPNIYIPASAGFFYIYFWYNSLIMPSIYTHQDFADRLLSILPEEIGRMVQRHPDCYHLGSLGPDPLYFYGPLKGNPLYSLGDRIHNQPIYEMLHTKKNISQDERCYLFGYITHYVLDRNCHEYIYHIDPESKIHHILEAELDKRIALQDMRYESISYVKRMRTDTSDYAFVSSILEVNCKKYRSAVKSMKRLIGLLMSMNPVLRFFTRICLSMTPRFHKYKEIMFTKEKNSALDKDMEELFYRFEQSMNEAKSDILEFDSYLDGKIEDIHFGKDYTFEGNRRRKES
jgi:hypothetical protein